MPRPTQVSLYSYHVARVPFSTCRKTHWECHTLLKKQGQTKVTAEGDVFRERYRHTRKKGKLRMLQIGVKPTIFRLALHLSLKSPGLHMRILANFWKASRAVSWLAWPCVYFSARFHVEGEGHKWTRNTGLSHNNHLPAVLGIFIVLFPILFYSKYLLNTPQVFQWIF